MIEVLFLGGRSGVGKSTVAYEVSRLLQADSVAHCVIEGDALCEVHPAADLADLTERNLAAVWGNYAELGHHRLIYTNTVSVLETDRLVRALGVPARVTAVLLTAADDTAEVRLRARETGSGLDEHVERSARAAGMLDKRAPDWVRRVATDGRSVVEIAEEVLAATGWAEEVLTGGGVNEVVRIGQTVRRPAGEWTPAVHLLLGHLEAAGFTGAPRAHGLDSAGREVLDFVPGDAVSSEYLVSDAGLRVAGELLRAYHDATAGFAHEGLTWYFPPREPAEVICHGDIAPYNTIFRDGMPVAFIDFDTAHPGPRMWDVAYAAYRFVRLSGEAVQTVEEQSRRLRLFCDAYGLTAADRAALPGVLRERLHAMVAFMRERAAAGDPAFAAHLAAGHDTLYLADAAVVTKWANHSFD